MASLKTARKAWHPRTDNDRKLIVDHLHAILREAQFANSKRYPAFLTYVVERTLEGNAAQIKERTIGVEVFHRPSDYDTNNDTVVRYTAGEVRKRLALYHHDHDDCPVEISIPQGSYVPEFLRSVEEEVALVVLEPPLDNITAPASPVAPLPRAEHPRPRTVTARHVALFCIACTVLALVVGALHFQTRRTALDRFWGPLTASDGVPLMVSGGVVFSPNPYSGVETAGKTVEYPFVSMQTAAALARVGALLQQRNGRYQIQPANSTNLNDLRDRPVVLIGAYNNPWTLRLLEDARLHLGSNDSPAILNRNNPAQVWQRDRSQPYASADDYAIVGRFRSPTTGGLTVVIGGLGRNGTEAGAQYLTDPHYLEELEQRLGHPIDQRNLEAVIRIKVVDGRTGAPSLESVVTW